MAARFTDRNHRGRGEGPGEGAGRGGGTAGAVRPHRERHRPGCLRSGHGVGVGLSRGARDPSRRPRGRNRGTVRLSEGAGGDASGRPRASGAEPCRPLRLRGRRSAEGIGLGRLTGGGEPAPPSGGAPPGCSRGPGRPGCVRLVFPLRGASQGGGGGHGHGKARGHYPRGRCGGRRGRKGKREAWCRSRILRPWPRRCRHSWFTPSARGRWGPPPAGG